MCILNALKDDDTTIEALSFRTGLDTGMLIWHLDILEYGLCVRKEVDDGKTSYKITREGKVVEYIDH